MISMRPLAASSARRSTYSGWRGVEPFHQRAAGVQGDPQRLVAAENVEKRQIAVFVGLLENVIEIADGLVIVEGEDQADGIGHNEFRREGRY